MNNWFKALGLAVFLLTVNCTASAMDGYSGYNGGYNSCCCSPFDGFYVGGNIGVIGWENHRTDLDEYLVDAATYTSHDVDVTAGVQLGYDWQCCSKVFGLIVDWNWTNSESHTQLNGDSPGIDFSFNTRFHWFTTIRGRAGITVCDALMYITAGAAVADFRTHHRRFITGTTLNDSFRHDHTRWGWVGGFGFEWVVCGCWSVNAELLYLFFDKHNHSFTAPSQTQPFHFDHSDQAWVGRIGINYRFGNLFGC